MKLVNALFAALLTVAASGLVGCAYGGAAGVQGDSVVVLRNDGFLWGLLRKAYVCKAGANGLSGCREGENP